MATAISPAGNGSDTVEYTGGKARARAGDIPVFSVILIFAHSLVLRLLNLGVRHL